MAQQEEPTSPTRPIDPSSTKNWFQRTLARAEPVLQHQGVPYTFLILHILLNLVIFFVGAAPAWSKAAIEPFVFRAATAIARGGGATLNYNAALVILVASRNLMTYLRMTILNLIVPFDKAMPAFHSLVGNSLVLGTAVHVLGHVIRYSMRSLRGPGMFGYTSLAISGSLAAGVLIAMRVTSLLAVRRRSFETFYWVHSIGAISFFVLIILHGSHIGYMKTYMYVTGPIVIYLIDRTVRLFREKGSRLSITRESAVIKGNDMVCLRIPRTFSYLAGQYCDIKVPLVSQMQWHPFTIASSPHESEMLFYIKVNGDWTRKLYALFKERDVEHEDVHIHVRGPYGAPAQHVGQYEHVVLVSGGVGATPFASITKYAHHWILNYTSRGAAASNTVSAAFTRNQSVQGTPSVPGTPTLAKSGYNSSGAHRSTNPSTNPSRHISRSQSRNFTRPASRNFSRTQSRNGSRPLSRSGSGRLERFNSSRVPDVGRQISRSGSGVMERANADRPRSGHMSRSGSGVIDRLNSGHTMDRATSGRTHDSVGIIIQEQRNNQPNGPSSYHSLLQSPPTSPPVSKGAAGGGALGGSRPDPDSMALQLPGVEGTSDDAGLRRYLDLEASTANAAAKVAHEEFMRPDDYDEELGNPELPIPDRRQGMNRVESGMHRVESGMHRVESGMHRVESGMHRVESGVMHRVESGMQDVSSPKNGAFEIVTEYDSSHALFDEDEEQVEEETPAGDVSHLRQRGGVVNAHMEEGFDFEDMDIETGGLELEDQILREQNTASNAYNMLGMSFGPLAMMRHMHAMDAKKLRSSMVRASMNLMDDAMDAALWQDRILFYLHTVTINWVLLWLMFCRFSLVLIGLPTEQFTFDQRGLGIFEHAGLNVVDLILSILVTIPIVGAVVMEMAVNDVQTFLSDTIANSFDVFVLVPLLMVCIVLHILNLAGIGSSIVHVSKLTVLCIWPVVSLFILWRIVRTIGSRIVLAPYFKSSHGQTKSLDYIWVSKTHEDDTWLIDELLPLAESNIVRLHRFITRHGPKTEPWMLEYEKVPLKTTYSRPDWDDVFGGLVERSKSGTVIGVFFCGPDSMAQMIQQAAMKAMAKSMDNAYQRGYFSKKTAGVVSGITRTESTVGDSLVGGGVNGTHRNGGGLGLGGGASMRSLDGGPGGNAPEGAENDSSAYGCSVRIAVRIENFT